MCVDVEPGMRTAAAVAWEAAAAEISLLVLALYLCSIESVAAACIAAVPVVAAARGGGGPQKPSDRVVGGAELCE